MNTQIRRRPFWAEELNCFCVAMSKIKSRLRPVITKEEAMSRYHLSAPAGSAVDVAWASLKRVLVDEILRFPGRAWQRHQRNRERTRDTPPLHERRTVEVSKWTADDEVDAGW